MPSTSTRVGMPVIRLAVVLAPTVAVTTGIIGSLDDVDPALPVTATRLSEARRLVAARAAAPVDAREQAAAATFAAALDALPRPFDEDADPTHVTSSAIVISDRGVLLLKHKRLGIWIQPGGHLLAGEDLATGAVREATEETGLVLAHPPGGPAMVHLDVHAGGRGHTHLDLRWLLLGSGAPAPPADESQDVAWFDWDAAIRTTDPGLAGALRALQPRS